MLARVAAACSDGKLEFGSRARPHPRRQLTGAKRGFLASPEQATVLVAHDVQRARDRLERAISKAWRTPEGHIHPNVPLRIQVTPPPGLRIEGRGWLDGPVLHWESSEIECTCKPWTPPRLQSQSSAPATQCRVKISSVFGAPETSLARCGPSFIP